MNAYDCEVFLDMAQKLSEEELEKKVLADRRHANICGRERNRRLLVGRVALLFSLMASEWCP